MIVLFIIAAVIFVGGLCGVISGISDLQRSVRIGRANTRFARRLRRL